ncbi:MAG: sigma 54-interacting transcriptional regulator [Rickettsiales bacterium]|jgi:DNA-binding NtrC family response regulator|nr:sigma 54-interacting transcriptional regulator [Rickettsiales bacterium]
MYEIGFYGVSEEMTDKIDKNKYSITIYESFSDMLRNASRTDLAVLYLEAKVGKKDNLLKLKNENANIKVIGLVEPNRVRVAVKLLEYNLNDFSFKDVENERLLLLEKIEKLLNGEQSSSQNASITSINNLVNYDRKLKKNMSSLVKIANTNMSILVHGERGCEHDLYAKSIHEISNRKNFKFVEISCSNMDGANAEKILNEGLSRAEGGTVFLDKIDTLNQSLQKTIAKIIGNRKTNVRIMASSVKNLKNPSFNEDLYHLVSTYVVTISSLRDMRNFVPLLVKNLYQYFAAQENKVINGITVRALKILESYSWPGNMKEIKDVMYKAVILSEKDVLDEDDFPDICGNTEANTINRTVPLLDENGQLKTMKALENEIIDKYLKMLNGNISEVSKLLGIGRATMYRKLGKYENS